MYTDGSSLGNPGPGGWAWWRHDECWAAGSLPHTTNQQAELVALLMALRQVPPDVPLRVLSDSQYAVNTATRWLEAWKRAGWRTAGGQQVANLTIVKHLDVAIAARSVRPTVMWVRGHSGVAGNEQADKAAVAAAYAERAGRAARGGPGWSASPARLSAAPPRKRPAARTGTGRPAEAGRKVTRDRGKSPGTVRGDGAILGSRPETGLTVMKCSACGTTLHPLSLDCRCTR